MHDFVPRADAWYTNQTCSALLEVFADVLPRARNVIRTMEYSRGDLKGQVAVMVSSWGCALGFAAAGRGLIHWRFLCVCFFKTCICVSLFTGVV